MNAPDWIQGADAAAVDSAAETVRAIATRTFAIRADRGAADPNAAATIAQMVGAFQRAAAAEKACRADAKCMTNRAFTNDVVKPLCEADSDREQMLAEIAAERSNPGGVVDKELLHNDGNAVLRDQQTIKELQPRYTAVRHHAFRGWRSECPAAK